MHPISLRSLIQGLMLAHGKTMEALEKEANLSRRRATEILQGLSDLGLARYEKHAASITSEGILFLELFKNSNWKKMHEILSANNVEYQTIASILRDNEGPHGLTISEICRRQEQVRLNVVISEVCLEWGIRLGIFQKNLYTSGLSSRYYFVSKEDETPDSFERTLIESYNQLNVRKSGQRLFYVSIPELREVVCERLRLRRTFFDEMLRDLCLTSTGRIELSGGPLTGTARKAPTRKLSIFADRSSFIMAPRIALEDEEGLRMQGRVYQMVAFLR